MNSRNTYILKRARVFMSLHFTCGGEVNSRQGRPLTTTRSRTDFDYRLQRAPPPPGAGWLQTSRATVWRAPRGECLSGLAEGRTCDRTQRFHPPLGRNCSGATRTHHPYGLNKGILYCTPLCATATSMNCLLSRHRFRHATPRCWWKGCGSQVVRPPVCRYGGIPLPRFSRAKPQLFDARIHPDLYTVPLGCMWSGGV
jgi:hypothetical protein